MVYMELFDYTSYVDKKATMRVGIAIIRGGAEDTAWIEASVKSRISGVTVQDVSKG
jgi:hypothetical protein